MIDSYSFGRIVVDGKEYRNDIKIIEGQVRPEWWRKEGHRLCLQDMQDALQSNPKIIVVGCGHDGVLKVAEEVRKYCEKKGIQLIELWTADAVKKYNEIEGPGVAGLFHLTC